MCICFIHRFIPDSWNGLSYGRHLTNSCGIKCGDMLFPPNKNGEAGEILPSFLLPRSSHSCSHSQVLEARRVLGCPFSRLLATLQPTPDQLQWPLRPDPCLVAGFRPVTAKTRGHTSCLCCTGSPCFTFLLHWTFVCFCLGDLVSDLAGLSGHSQLPN